MNRPLVIGGFAVLVAAVAVGWIVINQSETLDPQPPESTVAPVRAEESPVATTPAPVETPAVAAVTPESADGTPGPDTAGETAAAVVEETAEAVAEVADDAAVLLRRPGETTEDVAEAAAKAAEDVVDETAQAVAEGADEAVDAATALLRQQSEAVEETAEVVDETADAVVEETADAVVEETAGAVVDETADAVVNETADAVVNETADAVAIVDDASEVDVDGAAEPVAEASDGISAALETVTDAVGKAAESAVTVVTETAQDLTESARDGLAGLTGETPEATGTDESEVADGAEALSPSPLTIVPPDLTGNSEISAEPAAEPVPEQLAAIVEPPKVVPEAQAPEAQVPEQLALVPDEPALVSEVVAPVVSDAAALPEADDASVAPTAVVEPRVVARLPDGAGDSADDTEAVEVPTFDVVRVDRTGGVVIAGRSHPLCTVEVQDGDRVVGSAQANGRGEWVVVPDAPLAPGSRELGLRSVCGADEALSDRLIVVVVPERGQDIAGEASDADGGALALSVPRTGGGQTEVLQAPEAPSAGTGTEVAAGGDAEAAAIGLTALSVDVIDYSEDGDLELAGRAEAGAALRIYLDNDSIGGTAAGDDERWAITPEEPVAPGLYTLRVDQVARDGSVTARVELPFLRGEPLKSLPDDRIVIVQPGNSLWRIARRTYGDGVQFTLIFGANADQIRDPDLIYPGQIFTLPVVN